MSVDDATLLGWMTKHKQEVAWQEFENALRGILADHENATHGAAGADTHAARRRTVDKIEALYQARFAPEPTP